MTQPTQPISWVTEMIKRFSSDDNQRFVRPKPMDFDVKREPFDASSNYRDIQNIRNQSAQGTQVLQQRLAAARQQQMQALSQVPQQGIQPGMPMASGRQDGKTGRYGAPLSNYRQTSGFGPRNAPTRGASSNHRGVDLAAPQGTPIYATHDGYVQNSGWSNGYGNNITIGGSGGIQTFYGHNSRNVVKAGQYVRKGQVIGYVGSTGVSTGPHLHYGVMRNGSWINPAGYY